MLLEALSRSPVIHSTPATSSTVERMAARGEIVRVLPGVWTIPERCSDLTVRAAAVVAWRPDAVITGLAAARLHWWPGPYSGPIEVFTPHSEPEYPGVRCHRGRPDSEWWVEVDGTSVATPALTAVWLAASDDGAAIDAGLRLGCFRLRDLEFALAALGRRAGNRRRREVLRDSRDLPWSPLERRAHRILRAHDVRGWVANRRVAIAGRTYYIDIAFPAERLAVEVDGREYHSTAAAFQSDRNRHNALTLAGWTVLHVTAADLEDEGRFLFLIRACRRRLGHTPSGTRRTA